ncbi:MAG: DinB family protein, partial [Actinomycetales bacterium]|nr:DinB family protein [Actinomycetales bacterium]
EAVEAAAATFADVTDEQWSRRGLRGDGAAFTVETLGQYYAHDMAHHLWDVRG